eukprot:TRINITY_DN10477_c0_g1_i1.p1 TRINITY_DN10477_c0_g1~~TRINITY_DN10477_c0_g1_i1.p1  ORF type:complete len:184 (-),score=35.15 TRINITY_DN10477_c0_g1_i1:264-815(-)
MKQLDLDPALVQEIVGAKKEDGMVWFYVKWSDTVEPSFVPSSAMNRIAPDKVIQYYERILQFQPGTENPCAKNPTSPTINNNLNHVNGSSERLNSREEDVKLPKSPSLPLKQLQPPQTPHLQPSPPSQHQPPQPQGNMQPSQRQTRLSFRTMNCTGCSILLQYPEGTKAIKCPVCNTVMGALP